ncbi:hypothetical protein B0H34DRAFT_678062 [Crassisporium funariophilum]|nr:hypothetical protein B0H34DRAFT_678062 [Crassisporium funariophilum]
MAPPAFDYSIRRVVVQHGSIFYSPDCSWPVNIPQEPVHSSNPFRWQHLDISMFEQPVWWDQNWAWQSFILLAPSFLFAPFEPLKRRQPQMLGLSATVAPHAAPSVQSQGVPATVRETGRNYNNFFAACKKRQQEMIKLESAVDRQWRKSQEQKLGVTQLSGGLELYVKVNKKANKTVFHSYRSHQQLFNTFSNEWDLCEDFQLGIVDNTSYSDDIDMGQSWCVNNIPPTLSWKRMLNFMVFVRNLEELNVGKPERSAMMNFFAAVLNAVGSYKSDKVVAKNFENLSLL